MRKKFLACVLSAAVLIAYNNILDIQADEELIEIPVTIPGNTEPSEYNPGIRGDVNRNRSLDVFDLIRYKRNILDESVNISQNYNTDIDGDGSVGVSDYTKLRDVLFMKEKMWSVANLPVMDGSTSAIPLETGIKSKLLGLSYVNAGKLVKHHKTHESFSRLLSGENDMIFTVPISDDQKNAAEEAGVVLKTVPVAKEGFVFIVNKNNPVDTLTQEQIRDIYSGKITSWKEVGGDDAPIIAYQRNSDSGSQNFMVDFMGDTRLMTPPADSVILTMGSLIDGVGGTSSHTASYNNTTQAIGYSVYSYAAQMYENNGNIKFIKVDGVAPSRESMADSTYPLVSHTDIMYREDAGKNTLEFIDWVVSDEGQQCVLENGYVPAKDMEYPDYMKPYSEKGTGKEKPENYVPSVKVSTVEKEYYDFTIKELKNFRLDLLKDKEFENVINEEIKNLDSFSSDSQINFYAENGYASVEVEGNGKTNILNYDLINKKKIEKFSDLFYKDTDFIGVVNDAVSLYINSRYPYSLKADFIGMTGQIIRFSLNTLWFENDIYLERNASAEYTSTYLPMYMVTGEYFDMDEIIDDASAEVKYSFRDEWDTELLATKYDEYEINIKGSLFHTEEEINTRRNAYKEAAKGQKLIPYESFRNTDYMYSLDVIKLVSAGYDFVKPLHIIDSDEIKNPMFDPETGKQLTVKDIFGIDLVHSRSFEYMSYPDFHTNEVTFYYSDNTSEVKEFFPELINKKYFKATWSELDVIPVKTDMSGILVKSKDNKYPVAVMDVSDPDKRDPKHLEYERPVKITEKCRAADSWWYFVSDGETGKEYGWVRSEYLKLYPSEHIDRLVSNYSLIKEYSAFSGSGVFMMYDIDRDGNIELIRSDGKICSMNEDGKVYIAGELPEEYCNSSWYIYSPEYDSIFVVKYETQTCYEIRFADGKVEPGKELPVDKMNFSSCIELREMSGASAVMNYFNSYVKDYSASYIVSVDSEDGADIYSSSYIINKGEPVINRKAAKGERFKINRICSAYGKFWYGCFDAQTDEFIGMIDISKIKIIEKL